MASCTEIGIGVAASASDVDQAGENNHAGQRQVSSARGPHSDAPGTTSPRICRRRRRRRCTPAPASRSARTTSPPLFPMALIMQEVSAEREIEIPEPVREIYKLWRPAPLYPRPPPRDGSSIRRRAFSTSTRASARRAATSRTPPCRRPSTTARPASGSCRPRPAPASGARRSPSPGNSSASKSRSTWSRSATSRSPIAGR